MGENIDRDVEKDDGNSTGVAMSGGEVTGAEKISEEIEIEMGGDGEKGVNAATGSSKTDTVVTKPEQTSKEVGTGGNAGKGAGPLTATYGSRGKRN